MTEILLINRGKSYCQENILIKGGFFFFSSLLGTGPGNDAMCQRGMNTFSSCSNIIPILPIVFFIHGINISGSVVR